jgi:hypothetical protein
MSGIDAGSSSADRLLAAARNLSGHRDCIADELRELVDAAMTYRLAATQRPGQRVLVLANPNGHSYKSHAPDCRWVAGCITKGTMHETDFTTVPASSVPPSVGRCSFCGGGR